MKFTTVRELKNKTSEVLDAATHGKDVLITHHGRPIAVIHGLEERDFESYVLSHSPAFRKKLEEAERDIAQGRTFPLSKVCAEFGMKPRGKVRR